jgi:hypothetical protein
MNVNDWGGSYSERGDCFALSATAELLLGLHRLVPCYLATSGEFTILGNELPRRRFGDSNANQMWVQ